VLEIAADIELGKIIKGKVIGLRSFGVLIEVAPGRDGMCHISELSDGYIRNVQDVVKVGDEMWVKVIGFDELDRPRLSRRQALRELGLEDEWDTQPRTGGGARASSGQPRGGRNHRGGGGPQRRGGFHDRRNDRRR